jgi:hypothetical protein
MPPHSADPRIIGSYWERTRRLWLVPKEPLAYGWSEQSERREKLARSAVGRVLRVLYRVLHPRPILRRWLGGHPKLSITVRRAYATFAGIRFCLRHLVRSLTLSLRRLHISSR